MDYNGYFMDISWIFHGYFMDISWIFHGLWFLNARIPDRRSRVCSPWLTTPGFLTAKSQNPKMMFLETCTIRWWWPIAGGHASSTCSLGAPQIMQALGRFERFWPNGFGLVHFWETSETLESETLIKWCHSWGVPEDFRVPLFCFNNHWFFIRILMSWIKSWEFMHSWAILVLKSAIPSFVFVVFELSPRFSWLSPYTFVNYKSRGMSPAVMMRSVL